MVKYGLFTCFGSVFGGFFVGICSFLLFFFFFFFFFFVVVGKSFVFGKEKLGESSKKRENPPDRKKHFFFFFFFFLIWLNSHMLLRSLLSLSSPLSLPPSLSLSPSLNFSKPQKTNFFSSSPISRGWGSWFGASEEESVKVFQKGEEDEKVLREMAKEFDVHEIDTLGTRSFFLSLLFFFCFFLFVCFFC